jgi:hypothetical protein
MKNAEKKREALLKIRKFPIAYAKRLGFTKLVPLNNRWMVEMLTAKEDMTLQAHRGSYKTTCLSVVIALLLILKPNINIIFIRKTDGDVVEIIEQVKRMLLSDELQDLSMSLHSVPIMLTKSNVTEINTNLNRSPKGAVQLLGVGTIGSLTGKHADIVITDDITNLKDRVSRAERERTKRLYMELQNIRNRGGRIINCGTPWHKDDAFTLMPNIKRYNCYETGMLSPGEIKTLRASMTPSLFAANYELQHIAAENALFAASPKFDADEKLLYNGIAHIDAAYGGEDGTALTLGRMDKGTLYMYGKLWQGHVGNRLPEVAEICKRFRCAPIHCEINADKGYLARDMQKLGMVTRMYSENMNKYLKISTYLYKYWPKIVWIEGTDPEYLNQIMDYTEDAAHDDSPDSASCIARLLDIPKRESLI